MADTTSNNRLKQDDVSLTAEKHEDLDRRKKQGDRRRGKHPNSLANLKPFEKGVSGNPSGRAVKFQGLKQALKPYGEKNSTKWARKDWTKKEVVLEKIWGMAEEGSIPHITILANLELLDD